MGHSMSEQAHARLRDCNKQFGLFGLQSVQVRTGPRPIEGLQQYYSSARCSSGHDVRTGPRPIEGLQRATFTSGLSGASTSEQAHARLRDCNTSAPLVTLAEPVVRTGPRPIEGLQQAVVAPAKAIVPVSEQAHARLRDCNMPNGDAEVQSPKSEQAHARLRDCNYNCFMAVVGRYNVRTGPRPIEGLQHRLSHVECRMI